MLTRDAIVAEARQWVGTPFRHQHHCKGVATDCVGFVGGVLAELGVFSRDPNEVAALQPFRGYAPIPDGAKLREACEAFFDPIPFDTVQPGDIVLMAWRNGLPQHLGIVVPYLHGGSALAMVHAESIRHKRVVETRLVFGHVMRLVGGYAVKGIDDVDDRR